MSLNREAIPMGDISCMPVLAPLSIAGSFSRTEPDSKTTSDIMASAALTANEAQTLLYITQRPMREKSNFSITEINFIILCLSHVKSFSAI